jgi:N-acetylglucosaminyldiphosphoundecaprenol N-acetyl-beta-D-mannosaminyltransferase
MVTKEKANQFRYFDSTMQQIIGRIEASAPDWHEVLASQPKKSVLLTFVNLLLFHVCWHQPNVGIYLSKFDFVFADGILLAKLVSFLTRQKVERLSFDGNSLAPRILRHCTERALSVAIIGGKPGVADAAAEIFRRAFGIHIELTSSGYFVDDTDRRDLQRSIVDSGIDIVICGMGIGAQELFLIDLVEQGWTGVGFTCGGYLDQVVSRGVQYYPDIVERLHLRALYRLWREPLRLLPRYAIHYLPFYRVAVALAVSRPLSRDISE